MVWPPNSTISQPPPSGSRDKAFGVDAFRAGVVDEKIVEAFEADGVVLHDLGDVVGALKDVGIGDDQQHALVADFRPGGRWLRERWRRFPRSRRGRGRYEIHFRGAGSSGCSRRRGEGCWGIAGGSGRRIGSAICFSDVCSLAARVGRHRDALRPDEPGPLGRAKAAVPTWSAILPWFRLSSGRLSGGRRRR